MGATQYIGARYVPQIEGEHNPNRSYDALSIVTSLRDSYTSKKPVPVGVPITDTEYWVLTGNYNAQISEFADDLDAFKLEFDRVVNRKYVFIGDSFMAGYVDPTHTIDNFVDIACAWAGLEVGNDYFISAEGGAGFKNGRFLGILTDLVSSLTNPEEITDLVVIGGSNDVGQTVTNEANSLITYAKNNLPNAKIHFGFNAFSYHSSAVQPGANSITCNSYKNTVIKAGGDFIDNFTFALLDNGRNYVGAHPNEVGQNQMAIALGNWLSNKDNSSVDVSTDGTWTTKSDYQSVSATFDKVIMTVHNGIGHMRFVGNCWLGGIEFTDNNYKEIGTISGLECIIQNVREFPITAVHLSTASAVTVVSMTAKIEEGKLYLKRSSKSVPGITNTNIIDISNISTTFPMWR